MARPQAEPQQRARDSALRMLARREHSRVELGQKLSARGYAPGLVELLLDELEDDNRLSDARYAEFMVASRSASGYGPVYVRRELQTRGVAAEIIETALAAADIQWDGVLRAQYQRYFGSTPSCDFSDWARRASYLQRRGFGADAIRRVIGDWHKAG